jgi:hypothetical protein
MGHTLFWGSTRADVNAIRCVCRGDLAQLMKSGDCRTAANTRSGAIRYLFPDFLECCGAADILASATFVYVDFNYL